MLYPEKLKDNEYVALFFMKTDRNGDVIGKDGKINFLFGTLWLNLNCR